jgi:DNA mismatch repair ATPase MutS
LPRPTLVDLEETVINIEKGRHPVISLLFLSGDQFVANDTKLKVGSKFYIGLYEIFWKISKTICRLVHEL